MHSNHMSTKLREEICKVSDQRINTSSSFLYTNYILQRIEESNKFFLGEEGLR